LELEPVFDDPVLEDPLLDDPLPDDPLPVEPLLEPVDELFVVVPVELALTVAITTEPEGAIACQIPSSPCPLTSPAFLSWENR
jgi:hypothetical protein